MTTAGTPPPAPAPPTDDRAELVRTVTLLRFAVVLLDIGWSLLLVTLVLTGERPWPLPVSVAAFLAGQGLVAMTWRTR